jgi:hypothetical protein
LIQGVSACALVFCTSGCVIPLAPRSYPAPNFSREEIAFLDAPTATYEEVITTLGPPLVDLCNPGVMAYTREVIRRTRFITGDQHHELRSEVVEGQPRITVLLVAYDRSGQVLAHEVRKLEGGRLEEISVQWRLGKVISQ